VHKIFNGEQAKDYRAKYGMSITAVRPANVTGARPRCAGSVDPRELHHPARRAQPGHLPPHKDAMRLPDPHVDDVAEVFARVGRSPDAPKHEVYNTGGTTISLGDIAEMVTRVFLNQP